MAARISDEDDLEETHEINVTPFIDVILVLLIIFMVAAPLSTVDVPVDLPAVSAKPQQRPDKPIFVTIKKDLSLAVGENEVSKSALAGAVKSALDGRKDDRLFLRADKTVPYAALIEVMDLLRAGGFLKVALVGLEGKPAAPPAPGPDLPVRE